MVWHVNEVFELELPFLINIFLLERTNREKYIFKNVQHFASISYMHNVCHSTQNVVNF